MYRYFFCARTFSLTYMKHVIAELNNIDKFHGIRRIYTRTKARTDIDRQTECITLFNSVWKALKKWHSKPANQPIFRDTKTERCLGKENLSVCLSTLRQISFFNAAKSVVL